MGDYMRGLHKFVQDIRECPHKDAEVARVDKELANIRTRFKDAKPLSMYNRKKYVCKLLYMYMLGYDVDFGHMEVLGLISSPKFAEKQVGYLVTSVLLNETHDFLRLIINSIRTDIIGRNESHQSLALTCVGNIGGREMAEALGGDVQRLVQSSTARPLVRKKAALCLLRLYRKYPESVSADTWADAMEHLLDEKDLGLLTAVMSLLIGLVSAQPEDYLNCFPKVVKVLERLVKQMDIPVDYTYYGLPSPWLQVKCMRVLQYFPVPEDPSLLRALQDVTKRVLTTTEAVKNVNKNNAAHAVLFEALGLVMHFDVERELMQQCCNMLGKFIHTSVRDPNIRYLGLENMARLAMVPEMLESTKKHTEQIVLALRDPDISIRRRALDLLYGMCDQSNAAAIVKELLDYLTTADFDIREELTLKVAILAERFAPSKQWYVDTVVTLIHKSGEFVTDDIWHRVVQIVTNNADLQQYAATQFATKLIEGSTHESMLKVAGYVLGEFGHTLSMPPREYFVLLRDKVAICVPATKALLLSAFAKMAAHSRDPGFQAEVAATMQRYHSFVDAEMQQRAVEYFVMTTCKIDTAVKALEPMPAYPERQSVLERKMESATTTTEVSTTQRARSESTAAPASDAPEPVVEVRLPSASSPPPPTNALAGLDLLDDGAAPAPAAPAAGASPADLMSELLEPAPPAAPAPAPDPFAASGALDALMGPGDGSAAGGATAPPPTVDPQVAFEKLCVTDSGTLYEDAYLQLGLKTQYRGAQGRLALYFGNKHSAPMVNVRCVIPPTPALQVQAGSPPTTMNAKEQQMVQVAVSCKEPFTTIPALHVSYTLQDTQQRVDLTLQLPVVLCKFCTPLPTLSGEDFFGRWRALPGPPQKVQEVIQLSGALVGGGKAAVEAAVASTNFGVISGLDPNPANIVAAANLQLELAAPTGAVACMLRVEANPSAPGQVCVTVATPSPAASAALKAKVVAALT